MIANKSGDNIGFERHPLAYLVRRQMIFATQLSILKME